MVKRILKVAGPIAAFAIAAAVVMISSPASWSSLSKRVFMGETGTVGCGICCCRQEQGSPQAEIAEPGGIAASDNDFCTRNAAAVNYHTGENLFNTTDVTVPTFDNMSIVRHFAATTGYSDPDALGPGWRFWDSKLHDTGTQMLFVDGSRHSRSWTKGGPGVYTPDFFGQDKLYDATNSHLFRDVDGNGATFYATNYPTTQLRGKLFSTYSASAVDGASTTYSYMEYNYQPIVGVLKGQIQSKVNRNWVAGALDEANLTRFTYTVTDLGGGLGGRVTQITCKRRVNAGFDGPAFRTITLSYYLTTTTKGPAGSLRLVEVKDASLNVIESKYYRYGAYNAGTGQIELKYVVEGPSFERLKQASPSLDVDQANDTQMDTYANYKFTYDATFRCTAQVVQGSGGVTFTVTNNPLAPANNVNTWQRKSIEALPDGNQNIVYTNHLGQAVMKVRKEVSSGKEWRTWFLRDSAGRVIQEATPEAVIGLNESFNNLVDGDGGNLQHIDDSQGLILLTNYAASTTATTVTPGNVAGYIQTRQIKQGETGTAITTEAYTYIAHNSLLGGITVTNYPIASLTKYEDTAGAVPRTTSFAYTWYTSNGNVTNRIESRTTTFPIVTTSKNGSNAATLEVQFFDRFGKPTWYKDADGFIKVRRWDLVHQAPSQDIADVNTATTTDEPAGWATPAGGGLHLTTNYEFDALSRTTRVQDPNLNDTYTVYKDANWESRVYPGWTGTATTGPTLVVRRDRVSSYVENLTTSVAAAFSGGKPTGTETLDGVTLTSTTLHNLQRTFQDSNGRTTQVDSYHNFTGLTYTAGTGLGTLGTNFHRESYTYDSKGRREKIADWTGTIRKTVWDVRDRVSTRWIGTLDANLIKTAENVYDEDVTSHPGIGNDKVTTSKFFTTAATTLDTLYKYDFRRRLTDSRSSQNIAVKRTYDNMNRVTMEETYASSDFTYTAAELRGKREMKFDEKGQVYQTIVHNVDPSTGAIGNRLTSNQWSSARGQSVKQSGPNTTFRKTQYDGAGRVKATFSCYDDGETSYAQALDVASDTVIEQSIPTYDAGSRVIQMTLYERTNTAAVPGDLSSSWSETNSRRSYTATWYDQADRTTGQADYGRNGGVALSRPGSPPAPADAYIVTTFAYNAAGRQYRVTDNKARILELSFDMVSRNTKAVDNYVDGTSTETELDTDRTTEWVYDGSGRLSQLKAHNPKGLGNGVEIQTTTYGYGTDANLASPAVWRNDVLVGEIYPDSDDTFNPAGAAGAKFGNGADSTYDRVEYTYEYSGRKLSRKLQDTTLHTYTYDSVGRLFTDQATTLGAGIDGAVRRFEYAYDSLSRPLTVSSYSAVSAGTLLNQVRYTYDGWGNETKCEQGHEGTATGAPSFQKTFLDGAVLPNPEAKYVRVSQMTYPNARIVYWNYPSSGVGDKLSRVDNIANDSSGTLKFAQMTYLGIGSVIKRAHPGITGGLNLDLGTGTGNPGGWDDLGRIDDQKWQNDAATVKDRYQYGYDRTSNATFRDNLTATGKDHFSVYNGLDQLTTSKLGDLNAGRTDITGTPAFQESWTLESIGNWRALVQTTAGTTTLNQTRTHTKANETTTIAASVGTNWGDGVVDRNGFMTRVPKVTASLDQRWQLTSDAWLRVVKVVNDTGGATIAEYKYDGLNRRIVKLKPNGVNWDRRDYYYSCQWQVAEERELLNTASKTTVATVPKFQWVWGTRYIDEVVLRDENKDGDGDCVDGTDQRLYYAQDANWNVTSLVDTAGTVVEHVLYDAYGKHTLYNAAWSATQASSLYNNEVLFSGYRLDPETGLYQVRNRAYHPALGRWVQRDPLGYVDGLNLYDYVSSNPINAVDPLGLEEECGGTFPMSGVAQGISWNYDEELETKLRVWERARKKARDNAERICIDLGCPGGEVVYEDTPPKMFSKWKTRQRRVRTDSGKWSWDLHGWWDVKCTVDIFYKCPPKPKDGQPSKPKVDGPGKSIEVPADAVKPAEPNPPPPPKPPAWQLFWEALKRMAVEPRRPCYPLETDVEKIRKAFPPREGIPWNPQGTPK
jgi:RHS repeat-associated protein